MDSPCRPLIYPFLGLAAASVMRPLLQLESARTLTPISSLSLSPPACPFFFADDPKRPREA